VPSPPAAWPALTLAALGVVYGDIGTSPLYTVKEIFAPATGVALNAANLIGAVSVIFWALMLVVTLKYVLLILRADNHGEGGGLALTALAAASRGSTRRPAAAPLLLLLGVFGAARCSMATASSRRRSRCSGAMEGLEVATPALKPYVVPISVAILVGLFVGAAPRHRGGRQAVRPGDRVWFAVLAVFSARWRSSASRPSWRR
jgi:KUP system potassium uptake protein